MILLYVLDGWHRLVLIYHFCFIYKKIIIIFQVYSYIRIYNIYLT